MAWLQKYPNSLNYYICVWLPNQKKKRIISTRTKNKVQAEIMLKHVKEIENIRKVEARAIKLIYSDLQFEKGLNKDLDELQGIDNILSISAAVEKFIRSKKLKVSNETVKTYKLALVNFKNALGGTKRIVDINKTDFDLILGYLKSHFGDTTVNIRLRGIRVFLFWLVEIGLLNKLPFKIKQIKLKERLPQFLTPDDLQLIYNSTNDPILISTFKVYAGTGMRLSELKTSILEGNFIRVIGKGNKERVIPMPKSLIDDYQIAMAANYKTDRISSQFTKARRRAGVDDNKTLKSLRHTFALMKLVELGEKHLVQELLGHSSVTVTEVYTKFPIEYLKEVFRGKITS